MLGLSPNAFCLSLIHICGDMLFSQDGKIQRVQCALIETSEVEAICDSISEQIGYPCAYELPDYVPAGESGTGNLGAVEMCIRDRNI